MARPRTWLVQVAAASAIAAAVICAATAPAHANWLTKILKEAGDAGGTAGRHSHLPGGLGALDNAAAYIKGVSAVDRGVPLAAHATTEGHWKFANKNGDVFTAANPQEMQRVTQALAPSAGADTKISLYLSDATVFDQRTFIDGLPAGADLYFVDGAASYRLSRRAVGDARELFAEVRPNIAVAITERGLFDEALFQLNRRINRSDIRVLALEPGGPKRLSLVPGFDPATKTALVDAVDPAHARSAFSAVRGQTVVVSGRVEAGRLHASPASGGEIEVPLDTLTQAAAANDVNLVVLQSLAGRQPGGRNWLWQKVEVAGLDEAMKRGTFADFLNALGATRGGLAVAAQPAGQGRITLRAVPTGDQPVPLSDQAGAWFSEAASSITGNVITKSVEVYARDRVIQQERDDRLVSWLPSWVHVAYLAGLIIGFFSLPVARGWWRRVWPPEERGEYKGPIGYCAARVARGLAFVLLFMPLAGWPALPVMAGRVIWGYITAPVRFWRWMRGTAAANPN